MIDARASCDNAQVEISLLHDEHDWRRSYDVFMGALHAGPSTDGAWEAVRGLYHDGRVYGAFAADSDSDLLGTLMTTPLRMTLPGGGIAVAAGATFAGVRSGATRRGVFRRLVRRQLDDLAAQGEVFWILRPATAHLWERWGTAAAARSIGLRIDRIRSGPRTELARCRGRVRELSADVDLERILPALQRGAASGRAGTILRPDEWWPRWSPYRGGNGQIHAAVAGAAGDPDGYVTWRVEYEGRDLAQTRRVLRVIELFARTREAAADLWLHLLDLELVEEIHAVGRPLDEDPGLLLTDQRARTTEAILDELWLRVIDVPEALRLRQWAPTAGETVVLEVIDDYLPQNSGHYRITSEGAERVSTSRPDLTCTVSWLAALYLGDRSPSELAGSRLIGVHDGAALARADRLFAVDAAPWGGSMF